MYLYSTLLVVRAQVRITQCYLQITPYLPLPRKHSPDGASPDWGCGHLIAAYYSFIYSERTKGWVGLVGWPTADDLPTQVVTVSRRSSAGQRKFVCQRLMFYHCATQPFLSASLYFSKRGAYWDRLCRDVVGCHARALWQMVHPRPIVTMEH